MKFLSKFFVLVLASFFTFAIAGSAQAATTVDLGTAGNFAILAAEGITNVPTSVITGNVGLYPAAGSFYDGGVTQPQITGIIYSSNAAGPAGYVEDPVLLLAAKNDLTAAYTVANNLTPTATIVPSELGGQHLYPGVYASSDTKFGITAGAGPLVLDAQNDASAVFIFEGSFDATPALTVGPGSTVSLINDASACNVFWRVVAATIDTAATFKGNILAYTSITVAAGANIEGRLLAQTGQVTLISDTVAVPICTVATVVTTGTTVTTGATVTTGTTATTGVTATTGATAVIATPALPATGNGANNNSTFGYILLLSLAVSLSIISAVVVMKRKATSVR